LKSTGEKAMHSFFTNISPGPGLYISVGPTTKSALGSLIHAASFEVSLSEPIFQVQGQSSELKSYETLLDNGGQ